MIIAKRFRRSPMGNPRSVRRLQVEQFEHRLVMSGTSAADALGLALAADQTTEQVPMLIAPAARDSGVQTTQAEAASVFQRFSSLEEIKAYWTDHWIAEAVERYSNLFGKEICWRPSDFVAHSGGLIRWSANAGASTSDTNVQVAGVDEGDLMETDGNYLYMASHGELVIIDVRSTDHPAIAARLTLDHGISSMYLSGDRLAIVSQPFRHELNSNGAGYSLTEISVFDIADRTSPRIVQRTSFEGYLLDSAAIGDRLYLVLSEPSIRLNMPLPVYSAPEIVHLDGTPVDGSSDYSEQCRYETEQEYSHRMANDPNFAAFWDNYAGNLPRFTSFDGEGNEVCSGFITDPAHIYQPDGTGEWLSSTTVAVVDMASDQYGPVDAISLPTDPVAIPQVYISADSIYLLNSTYYYPEHRNGSATTLIRKIAFSGESGDLELVAEGTVAGRVLDQFSIDEHDGLLRIATTDGWSGDRNDNQLFVLEQNGTILDVVGSVKGLTSPELNLATLAIGGEFTPTTATVPVPAPDDVTPTVANWVVSETDSVATTADVVDQSDVLTSLRAIRKTNEKLAYFATLSNHSFTTEMATDFFDGFDRTARDAESTDVSETHDAALMIIVGDKQDTHAALDLLLAAGPDDAGESLDDGRIDSLSEGAMMDQLVGSIRFDSFCHSVGEDWLTDSPQSERT